MKICRFNDDRIGVVRDRVIRDVTPVLDELPRRGYPFPVVDVLIENLERLTPRFEAEAAEAPGLDLDEVALAAPVANPGKLIGAPVNYLKHLEEAQGQRELHHDNQIDQIHRVGLFLKATSSLIGPSRAVTLRFPDRRNDHELELAVVIGRSANRVAARDAMDHVAAYTIGLDMTARGPEERSLRKSIDTYSVLGPWMVTADEFGDPSAVDMQLTVNGELRQKANTRDLVLSIPELMEFASRFYTLHPGDVLFTGTPEGVGPVQPGDRIVATIDRIGELTADVAA